MELSLLSAIPICYFISWVGFIKKNGDDFEIKCDELEERIAEIIQELKRYKNIDLYKMNEQELRQFGASKGLSLIQIEILLMRVLERLKISEICKYRHYGRTTIKYHIAEIKRKLNIEAI